MEGWTFLSSGGGTQTQSNTRVILERVNSAALNRSFLSIRVSLFDQETNSIPNVRSKRYCERQVRPIPSRGGPVDSVRDVVRIQSDEAINRSCKTIWL